MQGKHNSQTSAGERIESCFSVSATTRPLRGKEKDGIDYFFLTVPEFRKRIENNEFVEWEEVYNGYFLWNTEIGN